MALMAVPDEGKLLLLGFMLRDDGLDFAGFVLRLFANNYVPFNGSTFTDFVEPDGTWYNFIVVQRSDFQAPVLDSHVAETEVIPVPQWAYAGASPAEDIYGWFLTYDDTESTVLFAQRFNSPVSMDTGVTLRIDPFKIKLKKFD